MLGRVVDVVITGEPEPGPPGKVTPLGRRVAVLRAPGPAVHHIRRSRSTPWPGGHACRSARTSSTARRCGIGAAAVDPPDLDGTSQAASGLRSATSRPKRPHRAS